MVLKTALFWVILQRVVEISYRRFETTYRSHLLRSDIHKESRLSENGVYIWKIVGEHLQEQSGRKEEER
jgi:hypothetical protein